MIFIAPLIKQKKALALVGLSILGISYGGRIRTNEPDIYALFVDFFFVDSQEEILPILQDIVSMNRDEAIEIAKQLSNREKDEFRTYMVDVAGGDSREGYLRLLLSCKTLDSIQVTLIKTPPRYND